jgi:hypothetical protein
MTFIVFNNTRTIQEMVNNNSQYKRVARNESTLKSPKLWILKAEIIKQFMDRHEHQIFTGFGPNFRTSTESVYT